MARRSNRNTEVQAPPVEAPVNEESAVSTATPEAPAPEAPESTEPPAAAEAPAESKPAKVIDLTAFKAAVGTAAEQADTSTGEMAPAVIEPVVLEYQKLEGQKARNAAKNFLGEQMRDQMNKGSIVGARTYLQLTDAMVSPSQAAAGKTERVPSDPTEAFVQRAVATRLAATLVATHVPEGVTEDWSNKAKELFDNSGDAAKALYEWTVSTAEDKGDAPASTPAVRAAVKIALGRAAGKAGKASQGRVSTYTGDRRDTSKHIAEAFADEPVGKFLKVAEIVKHRSSEYGDDSPSPGAISSRLKSPKFKLEGIEPAEENGKFGARKTA